MQIFVDTFQVQAKAAFPAWWARLEGTGCTYEFADEGTHLLYAADVPPKADIYTVYRILQEGDGFQFSNAGTYIKRL